MNGRERQIPRLLRQNRPAAHDNTEICWETNHQIAWQPLQAQHFQISFEGVQKRFSQLHCLVSLEGAARPAKCAPRLWYLSVGVSGHKGKVKTQGVGKMTPSVV